MPRARSLPPKHHHRFAAVVVSSLAVLVLLAGCKPKVGGKCKAGRGICTDRSTALTCSAEGTYAEMTCKGPLGCTKFGTGISCDSSIAEEGAVCAKESEEDFACTPNKKRALVCRDGKFQLHLECRGQRGCSILGKTLTCDNLLAQKTDPCTKQGTFACSTDAKNMLICKDGKFDVYRYCRGQNGCSLKTDGPNCDESVSDLNDPCGIPGMLACSTDGKNELLCQGGKYVQSRPCKKYGCQITNTASRRIDCQ